MSDRVKAHQRETDRQRAQHDVDGPPHDRHLGDSFAGQQVVGGIQLKAEHVTVHGDVCSDDGCPAELNDEEGEKDSVRRVVNRLG